MFQAKNTGCTKALRGEYAWCVHGMARRPESLEVHEEGEYVRVNEICEGMYRSSKEGIAAQV